MTLKHASVLITGGSRGLGRALARVLASQGARLVLIARGEAELNATVDEIRASGGVVDGIVADIGDKAVIHAIAGQAAALAGPIDVLIHNASTLGVVPLRLLLDTDCENLEHAINVNLVGPFRLTRAIAGSMALRGTGLVLSITSDASVQAYSNWGAYSISKAGLDHMNRLFATELQDTGVRFLCVDPGDMDTAMHAAAVPHADPATLQTPEASAQKILNIIRHSEDFPNGSRLLAAETEVLQ